MNGLAAVAVITIATASAVLAQPEPGGRTAAAPEVWLCPGGGVKELVREDASWPFVKQNLTGLKLYIDQIDQAAPELVVALVKLVREQGYQVAVECGGCLDFGPMDETNGEWSARLELAKIANTRTGRAPRSWMST